MRKGKRTGGSDRANCPVSNLKTEALDNELLAEAGLWSTVEVLLNPATRSIEAVKIPSPSSETRLIPVTDILQTRDDPRQHGWGAPFRVITDNSTEFISLTQALSDLGLERHGVQQHSTRPVIDQFLSLTTAELKARRGSALLQKSIEKIIDAEFQCSAFDEEARSGSPRRRNRPM